MKRIVDLKESRSHHIDTPMGLKKIKRREVKMKKKKSENHLIRCSSTEHSKEKPEKKNKYQHKFTHKYK